MAVKIAIIVPAYNEERNIAGVIQSLKACDPAWHVIVINDGSVDKTAQVAMDTGLATVLSLPCNLGIGGGVQTGFKYAHRNGFDVAVQFDGDGQHVAEEIPRLVAPIVAGEADVVIGSRFCDPSQEGFKSTRMRRVGIKTFELLNSLLIKQRITDNTSGFRAYNRKAISLLGKLYPVDYPEPEAVILLGRNGFTIAEIPVRMKERQGGVSSISGFHSAYYMVKVILSILIEYMRPPLRPGSF